MKLSPLQITQLAQKVLSDWKSNEVIQFKADEKKVLQRLIDAIKENLQQEKEIEAEAEKILTQLEKSNPGEFSRHKMHPMIKQKIAKERKFVI